MTGIAGLVVNYLHYAVGACAIGGVLLYAVLEKNLTAKPDSFPTAIRWAADGGSIPVCIAYMALIFEPDLWVALQDYYLLAAVYGAYHLTRMAQSIKPTLRAYLESKSRKE
ncbi:MAG: hypothetical protein ACR2P4_02110 [Gammaproteobacteria bacterium]